MIRQCASKDVNIVMNIVRAGAFALTIPAVVAAVTLVVPPQEAAATFVYSQQTKLPCQQCHASGGKLTAFGEKFKANGNKLPNPDQR
jgi:hypothetical protein